MGKVLAWVFILLIGIVVVGRCSRDEEPAPTYEEMKKTEADLKGFDSPRQAPTVEGIEIPSPSDPGASYRILKIGTLKGGNLEVLSRRDGRSGTSFARREIDCAAYTYRYLGEGDTRAEAEHDS